MLGGKRLPDVEHRSMNHPPAAALFVMFSLCAISIARAEWLHNALTLYRRAPQESQAPPATNSVGATGR